MGRSSDAFTKEMLENSQGFQFTVKEEKITHFDIDSSITSAQITRGIQITPDNLAASIEETMKRSDLGVLNIKSIRINNYENVLKVIGKSEEEFEKILNLKLKDYLQYEIRVEGISRNTKYLNN